MKENYIQHCNRWWWGKTITLIHNKGLASVEIQCDNDYPNVAFIKNLIVFEYTRKKGIGTDLLRLSEDIAKSYGKRFTQLSADINKEWLVKWYEKNGYVIIYKDEHEYTMLKALNQD